MTFGLFAEAFVTEDIRIFGRILELILGWEFVLTEVWACFEAIELFCLIFGMVLGAGFATFGLFAEAFVTEDIRIFGRILELILGWEFVLTEESGCFEPIELFCLIFCRVLAGGFATFGRILEVILGWEFVSTEVWACFEPIALFGLIFGTDLAGGIVIGFLTRLP